MRSVKEPALLEMFWSGERIYACFLAHLPRLLFDPIWVRVGSRRVGKVTAFCRSVDGKDVSSMDVIQVRNMLRGRAGTTILLGLYTEVLLSRIPSC